MLKNVILKTNKLLTRPFREHFLFLVTFFVLATSIYFFRFIYKESDYYYSFILAIHCLLISYLVTLLIGFIRNSILRKIIQSVFIGIAAVLFGVNTYCFFELDKLLDEDYLMLILGTNPNEAREFATSMVSLSIIFSLIAIYLFFIILWVIFHRHPIKLGKKISLGIIGVICLLGIKNWGIYEDGPIGHLSTLFTSLSEYEIPDESQLIHTTPTLKYENTQQTPKNVVLIIGESFARFHSSIYGYNKTTNPLLGSLQENSLLFAFDSVNSPAPTTSLSLKYMLTTFDREENNATKQKWYEFYSIIDLMKACGFDCFWFSNQARTGKYNYIGRLFAETCNQSFFLQNEGSTAYNNILDINLVDTSSQFINSLDSNQRKFIIYHLMGSHFDYKLRYPQEYNLFIESDYPSNPQNQRKILATYDNSILYNDFVVSQIIDLYKDDETIVVYVPDHGQDMFCSSPNYHMHGKIDDPISNAYGIQIPFMIYASPAFQKKNPDIINRIIYRQNNPKLWNSENLPFLIMDLMGIKSIDDENVKTKSAL